MSWARVILMALTILWIIITARSVVKESKWTALVDGAVAMVLMVMCFIVR